MTRKTIATILGAVLRSPWWRFRSGAHMNDYCSFRLAQLRPRKSHSARKEARGTKFLYILKFANCSAFIVKQHKQTEPPRFQFRD